MLINIDGKQIEIPVEMIEQLVQVGVQDVVNKYQTMEPTYRIGIKTFLRTFIFPALEKMIRRPVRPPKQTDPLEYLFNNIAMFIQETSKNAAINIKTAKSDGSTHRPTAFALTLSDSGEGGRQLAFNWQEGKRENNIREEAAR